MKSPKNKRELRCFKSINEKSNIDKSRSGTNSEKSCYGQKTKINKTKKLRSFKNIKESNIFISLKKNDYLFLVILGIIFFICVGYAKISDTVLNIKGDASAVAQDGIFITNITKTAEVETESSVNYFYGSMFESKVVLDDTNNFSETFEITVYNKTDREQVFIDALTDFSDDMLYDNENIEFVLNGIEQYKTSILPGEYLTFTITYKYKDNADTTNNVLNNKINFRFKQNPILELSNNGEIYTLTNIGIGHVEEYEFTVSNYNQTYNNGVPLTYRLETELTEGSPFEVKIYNENRAEVTGDIEIAGDQNTQENHIYTLKLTWNSNLKDSEYMGKEYTCQVKLIGKTDDVDYIDYSITKEFKIDITTQNIIPISTAEQLLKMGSNEIVTIDGIDYIFSPNANYQLQNDITFEISDYIEEYPDAFEGSTTVKENEITDYDTANSNANQYYTYTAPATGTYKLQVWGAQGGYSNESLFGGLGGYSIGTIVLNQGDKLYVYVGGKGGKSDTPINGIVPGGYNGGGYRYGYTGGGGATDIRLTAGLWNNSSSLLSRVIVAGGGGSEGSYQCFGGYGGGSTGESAWEGSSLYDECGNAGTFSHSGFSTDYTISTQTTTGLNSDSLENFAGGFGFGGAGTYLNGAYGGAGGGGWYGGAGVIPDGDIQYTLGGGGGSGYVWTEQTAQYAPTGYSVGTEYYLIDAATYGGYTDTFESPTGETVRGNDGDGYARITLITGLADTTKWIDCEMQMDRGTLQGKFEYDGYTITVGENIYPSIPTVTANVSDITTEKATITAIGNDPGGDELKYTLKINGKTYGPSLTNQWTIDKLNHNATYSYAIEVTDGHNSSETIGTFTTKELTITAEASDITVESATITAKSIQAGEDKQQYTLTINGQNYGPDSTKQWNIGSLQDYTSYSYTVTVTDGTNTNSYTGNLKTLCIHDFGKESKPQSGKKYSANGTYSDGVDTAMIPAQFTVSGVLGGNCKKCGIYRSDETTIETGLVIYLINDKTAEEVDAINWNIDSTVDSIQQNYDQFVWIPIKNSTDGTVEDINDMYICQNKGKTAYGSENCSIIVPEDTGKATCTIHGNSTAMAGRFYANNYGESFGLGRTEKYTSGSGLREPDTLQSIDGNATGLGYMNSILQTNYTTEANFKSAMLAEYNNAAKSVYENQGFYIGRYETSNITTTNGNAVTVRAGKTPAHTINWYYMYAQQIDYAANNGLAIGSMMVSGTAYDQVMKFINSESFNVTLGGHVGHSGSEFNNKPYLTGRRDYDTNYNGSVPYNDVQKNIFDLEGNVREWSLEARATSHRIIRGGDFSTDISPSARSYSSPTSALNILGTRMIIYIK